MAEPSYVLFSGTEVLGKMAMEPMLSGLSPAATARAEPVGRAGHRILNGDQQVGLSRKFVAERKA